MSTLSKTFLTPQQYLEIEREAEYKSEYYQGEMIAMAGASYVHNLLVGNTLFSLRQGLRSRPCSDGRWLLTSASRMEDSLDLQSVGCRLTLADLYEKVDLSQSPPARP